MLTREDIQKIADINQILQLDGDECELDIDDINWLLEVVIAFDVENKELRSDNEHLRNSLDILLGKLNTAQKEKMRNSAKQ